ncbi:D-alanyl-D-alanine carboxypeptidase [Parasulfuritortus cantonensis]|uniref:serine-type D-Ala-D-Ala carboxypeptidase n=1 Tax=Parasulfuritortus cantonensis TaxID=2528202 RepID=A0A4R1B785_9PROT|nr:D-alanyl-D-alanine carboxypeptidase family protein [Parasulfuritortus cantonensis]TCJ12777.1 D-alanyl-D-alanine carboxypeptidase [Parasulfuritortus cantonensis]
MKVLKTLLPLLFACAVSAHAALPVPPAPSVAARAWLLVDVNSGRALAENAPDSRIEPASLTKLMTAYLSFSAIKEGRLKLDQTLPVSEKAWKAEGSRMFLDPRNPAKVDDLLKGMIVQSGNDACITLAEGIAGTEDGFAAMMNQQAKHLGMTGSHFVNATGLPDPQHYTTARDLARLASAVIRDFPEFYKYYSLKEFTYGGITQPNRNRLLWTDPAVDGVKTGHTESAGYCLIASAKRDDRRLLSVVLGTASDNARASESQKLLNYGFQFYETVKLYRANQPVTKLRIYKGTSSELAAGFARDFYVTVPRGSAQRLKAQIISKQPMLAPISKGQAVATLRLTLDGQPVGDYALAALTEVSVSGLIRRAWDSLMLML